MCSCVPVFLCCCSLEACALDESQIASLDFVINYFLYILNFLIRIILKLLKPVNNFSHLNDLVTSWREML